MTEKGVRMNDLSELRRVYRERKLMLMSRDALLKREGLFGLLNLNRMNSRYQDIWFYSQYYVYINIHVRHKSFARKLMLASLLDWKKEIEFDSYEFGFEGPQKVEKWVAMTTDYRYIEVKFFERVEEGSVIENCEVTKDTITREYYKLSCDVDKEE